MKRDIIVAGILRNGIRQNGILRIGIRRNGIRQNGIRRNGTEPNKQYTIILLLLNDFEVYISNINPHLHRSTNW